MCYGTYMNSCYVAAMKYSTIRFTLSIWFHTGTKSVTFWMGGRTRPPKQRKVNKWTDKQTDRQTDRQTDKQTDRQADRQTDRQIDRQTDRQTDR